MVKLVCCDVDNTLLFDKNGSISNEMAAQTVGGFTGLRFHVVCSTIRQSPTPL